MDDLMDIRLTDLIDAGMLQKIQDAFANATGMAALTVDLEGPVTQLSNPTEFCMNLTRGCPKGAERCNQCDLKGGEEAVRLGRPAVYYCHGGLMDFAAPIMVGKRQIGSLLGGQVLPSPPDPEKFRRIAREIGVNEEAYLRALAKVEIKPKKSIEAAAGLLYIIGNSLSEVGYQRYQTQNMIRRLSSAGSDLHKKVDTVTQNFNQMEKRNKEFMEGINALMKIAQDSRGQVDQTDQILKYIGDISMQTKLLGFNASVEASRAKEYGSGFSVIAKEIRSLADNSQAQSGRITDVITMVKNAILNISEGMMRTQKSAEGNAKLLEEISTHLIELNRLATEMEDMGYRH